MDREQAAAQVADNIARGDLDPQHLLEWLSEHSTDPLARDLADRLFDAIEADDGGVSA